MVQTFLCAYILAQFGAQFLESLFLVLTDGLQLDVFILETMELLEKKHKNTTEDTHQIKSDQILQMLGNTKLHTFNKIHFTISLCLFTFFSPLICSASVLS